jgi:hypothetical protein
MQKGSMAVEFFLVCVGVNENVMEITLRFKIVFVPFQKMLWNVNHHISLLYQLHEPFLKGLVMLGLYYLFFAIMEHKKYQ